MSSECTRSLNSVIILHPAVIMWLWQLVCSVVILTLKIPATYHFFKPPAVQKLVLVCWHVYCTHRYVPHHLIQIPCCEVQINYTLKKKKKLCKWGSGVMILCMTSCCLTATTLIISVVAVRTCQQNSLSSETHNLICYRNDVLVCKHTEFFGGKESHFS